MLLIAHPSGNTFFRAAARAFLSRGWLQELHSCICWNPHAPFAKILPPALADTLARRSFNDVPFQIQHSHPWRELARLTVSRHFFPALHRHESGILSVDAVYRSFDRCVASRVSSLRNLRAVYAYEDAALHTFQAARTRGLYRVYDLPIGHWRSAQRIFAEERELQPAWACTLSGLGDSPEKLARKDQELSLANAVVVPSQFVRSTLELLPNFSVPIHVVPFGAPPPLPFAPAISRVGPLKVLYVGSLGQRKGLAYVLEAVAQLGPQVSLTLIGRPTSSDCSPLNDALVRHRWIPTLPHSQILEQMRQHDVLLLPSLFEGFALVIHEALSQGLPVIATANTGACETVRDNVEGFIVPLRDSQAIAERLQLLADDRDRLFLMRRACLLRAYERSWQVYENALATVLEPWFLADLSVA